MVVIEENFCAWKYFFCFVWHASLSGAKTLAATQTQSGSHTVTGTIAINQNHWQLKLYRDNEQCRTKSQLACLAGRITLGTLGNWENSDKFVNHLGRLCLLMSQCQSDDRSAVIATAETRAACGVIPLWRIMPMYFPKSLTTVNWARHYNGSILASLQYVGICRLRRST